MACLKAGREDVLSIYIADLNGTVECTQWYTAAQCAILLVTDLGGGHSGHYGDGDVGVVMVGLRIKDLGPTATLGSLTDDS